MKKVLILAYDFPPYVSVGGLRPFGWYRYLKEFDVDPIVITRQWGNVHGNHLDYVEAGTTNEIIVEQTNSGTILRTPYNPNLANRINLKYGNKKYSFLRKSISGYYEFAQFIFPIGPKVQLLKAAREYLKTNKVDAIIATGDPFILFNYAAKLSDEFNIPWIADYRDLWSHCAKGKLHKKWARYFEKKTLKRASHITTVSGFMEKKINELNSEKPITVVSNGFDPELIDNASLFKQSNTDLEIAFVGTIYEWHPIEKFIHDLEEFVGNNPDCKLKMNFYGTNFNEEIQARVKSKFPKLIPHLKVFKKMPNPELIEKIAQNNLLLLFNDYSYLGTKIYDYLGIKRKIILCYSNDPEATLLKAKFYNIDELDTESKTLQADLIEETNSGIIVKDSNHLKQVLQDLYTEFEEKGYITCNSIGIENYSRKIQVEKLAELIKTI